MLDNANPENTGPFGPQEELWTMLRVRGEAIRASEEEEK